MPEMKILLIDESPFSEEAIKPELISVGYEVDHAKSYAELQKLLKQNRKYSVILVERDLPEVAEGELKEIGLQIAKKMQKKFALAQIYFFDSGDGGVSGGVEDDFSFFKQISRNQPVAAIVQEIEQAGRASVEKQLKVARNQLDQISKITAALIAERSHSNVYKAIVNGVTALGFDRVRLYLLDDADTLKGVAQCGLDAKTARSDKFLTRVWDSHFFNLKANKKGRLKPEIFRKGGRKQVQDYETRMDRPGLEEWVIVPLMIGGKPIGKLSADNLISGRKIFADDIQVLAGLAAQAAVAIENLQAKQKEAQKAQQLEGIHRVALKINQLSKPEEVYELVSRTVVEMFDSVDHSGLVIFDQDYRFGRVVSEFPNLMESIDIKMPIKGIPFEDRLLEGAPYVTSDDVRKDRSMQAVGKILSGLGIKSVVIIPLLHENRLLGSLSLDATKKKHKFSQEEIDMAQIFAAHVAATIVNHQQFDDLNALNNVSKALNQITNLDPLLEEIVDHAVKFVQGKNGGIHLVDEAQHLFRTVADKKRSGSAFDVKITKGMVGHMFGKNLPFLITDNYEQEDYRLPKFCGENGIEALLTVALKHNQKPIGYLYVEDELGREFAKKDVERLTALASLAGSALYQSQLLKRAKDSAQQLKVLHDIGDIIESAETNKTVINFSLIALTAKYSLNFDRAAYFLIDSNNPNILRGRAAHGHLNEDDYNAYHADLLERGITDRRSQENAYRSEELGEAPLNRPVRDIAIDLTKPESAFVVELLNSQDTWFHSDPDGEFISKMPKSIQNLFRNDGPAVIVPMIVANQKVGLLIVDNPFTENISDSARLKALKTFVTSTAAALLRIKVSKEERKKSENLQLLSSISQKAAGLKDPAASVELVIRTLRDISKADNVAFIRVNLEHLEQHHLWAPKTIYSVNPVDELNKWMRSTGNSVQVLKSGELSLYPDMEKVTENNFRYAKGFLNTRSAACFPAIASDKQIGVVWFYFSELQEFNSQEQIDLWQLFVNQAATLYQLHSDYEKLESEIRLSEGVQEMVVAKDLDGVYDHVVQQAKFVIAKEEEPVKIGLYGFDAERKRVTRTAHSFLTNSDIEWQSNELSQSKLVEQVLESGGIIKMSLSPQAQETERTVERFEWELLLPKEDVKAVSLIPISWQGNALAVMAIGYMKPQPFSESQSLSLDRMAKFAGVALHNANELKGKDVEKARYNALAAINELVIDGENANDDAFYAHVTKELYNFMRNQAKPALFCDLRLRKGGQLNVRSVYPEKFQSVCKPIDLNQSEDKIGLTGLAFLQKRVTLSHDVTLDQRYRFTNSAVKSELTVPIMVRDHAIGVLNIEFSATNAFTVSDIELIEAFASRIASLMVKFHKISQLTAFHKASTIVAQAIIDDVDTQTNQILEQAVTVLDPLNGSKPFLATISLKEQEEGNDGFYIESIFPEKQFDRWVGRENAGKISGDPLRIGLARNVQLTGIPEISGDVSKDLNYFEINPTTCSEMAVPLWENNKVIGSLSVESEQLDAFMQEDLDALNTFAQLVMILRKSGRQYSELMDARTQVESVTALSLMTMIAGVWQHANKNRAITIRDRTKLIELDLADENYDDVKRHLEIIKTAATRISSRKMRTSLADASASKPEIVSSHVREFIATKVGSYRNSPLKIKTNLVDDKKHPVRLQNEWFVELIDIIFNNARRALHKTKKPEITITSSIEANQLLKLEIRDNGPGFTDEIEADLFTKIIKKKPNEEGSGIGLLMAKLIVESFGGKIEAHNVFDDNGECEGAYIEMSFPIDQQA